MTKQKRNVVVISDTQMPYEDAKALKLVIRFIGDYQPDEVVHIGDVIDYPQPSRWTKDTRAEFEGSVFEDSKYTVKNLVKPLREAYDGPVGFLEGNHDLRPRAYLEKYAPALSETNAFDMATMLEFEAYEITQLPDFYDVANGWVCTHGHLGGIRLTQVAGNTALNAARKLGVSVIMGHTHRLGIGGHSVGYQGQVNQQLTGMEVGNLMDMSSAGYLKGGSANWQQGFGLLNIDGDHVQATPVQISTYKIRKDVYGKKFVVDGETYRI